MRYIAPTPEKLRALKESLGYTGEEMAELFGLGGGHQWRKYTGGEAPREMNMQMLLYAAMNLELDTADVRRVFERAIAMGGQFPDTFNPDEVYDAILRVRRSDDARPKSAPGIE